MRHPVRPGRRGMPQARLHRRAFGPNSVSASRSTWVNSAQPLDAARAGLHHGETSGSTARNARNRDLAELRDHRPTLLGVDRRGPGGPVPWQRQAFVPA